MKGQKTGGRQKGTPNKTPAAIKEILLKTFNAKQIKADLAALSPRDRLIFITKILPYICPREVERVEVSERVEQPLFGDVPDDDDTDGDTIKHNFL